MRPNPYLQPFAGFGFVGENRVLEVRGHGRMLLHYFFWQVAEREAVNRPRGRKGASCSARWALPTSRSRTWLGISTETYSQVAASIKLTWAIRGVSASIQAVAELALKL